jgi:hypothetical protein
MSRRHLRRLLQQAGELESAVEEQQSLQSRRVLLRGRAVGQHRGPIPARHASTLLAQACPRAGRSPQALFSLAASQGHAQANQMLDSIQLASLELPACVTSAKLPEKAPSTACGSARHSGASPLIDGFVGSLASKQAWLVP